MDQQIENCVFVPDDFFLNIKNSSASLKKVYKKTAKSQLNLDISNLNKTNSFCQLKNYKNQLQKHKQQQKYGHSSGQDLVKEQQKIKKNLQELAETKSHKRQIGGQYGDYNYDTELSLVIKKGANYLVSQRNTDKARFDSGCNQVALNKKNRSKQQGITQNFHQTDRLNSFNQNQYKNPKQKIKQMLKLYDQSNEKSQQPQPVIYKFSPQPSIFGSFLQMGLKKQVLLTKSKALEENIHRRSKTQPQGCPLQKQRSEQIFLNYKKLKENNKKAPSTSIQKLKNLKQLHADKQKLIKKQPQLHSHSFQRKNNNSKIKYKIPAKFQNIFPQSLHTARISLTPKSVKKTNFDQNLKKLIKVRQKNFFQNVLNSKAQCEIFTFEQIKSKISKIEQLQRLRNNRSVCGYNENKKHLGIRDQLQYVKNDKETDSKDNKVKLKGISLKANLIKKHTNFYESKIQKKMQELNRKIIPKISKIHL